MFGLGAVEIVLLVTLGLFLFGSQHPLAARWLGKSVSEFKAGVSSLSEDVPRQTT